MQTLKKEQHKSNDSADVLLYIVLIALVVTVSIMTVLIAVVSPHIDTTAQATVQNEVTLTYTDYGINYYVYKHEQTGVYYLFSKNGGFCVMLNPDGTPYTGE